jgi:pantoate--beta-alanine ligase
MVVTDDPHAAADWALRAHRAGLSVGLVPTMGALHAGHFSLIERARKECDRVAVSIFVNPSQFGPGEDLDRYPRTLEADLKGCRQGGVDLVLAPGDRGAEKIYPPGFQSWVEVKDLSGPLCGERRPGHFRGVATVVTILFGIFRPHRAYFGQKDFQQARIIARMSADLRLGSSIVICPTVREPDGLALSSRNRFLSAGERKSAAAIPTALREAEGAFLAGEMRASRLEEMARARLGPDSGLRLDYARVLDAATLKPVAEDRIDRAPEGAVVAVAAFAGTTRLIDNCWLRPGARPPALPARGKGTADAP